MNALPTLVCALHGVCLQGRSAGPRAPTSANMDDAYAIGPGPRWSSQRRAALERFAAAALRSATALEVQQAKYACWSPDYDLERCPWRQRVGAGIGGEDIAATRRRSSPRHVWWRDGRSTLLVSAAGSDARTKASGMMAGFPCPGAATNKPPAVAQTREDAAWLAPQLEAGLSSQIEKNSSAVTSCTAVCTPCAIRQGGGSRARARSRARRLGCPPHPSGLPRACYM